MSFQISDSKIAEFKNYLGKSGAMDILTRSLLGLYEVPEKPNNALEYSLRRFIVRNLGAPSDSKKNQLKDENEDLKIRNSQLKLEVEQLKQEKELLLRKVNS